MLLLNRGVEDVRQPYIWPRNAVKAVFWPRVQNDMMKNTGVFPSQSSSHMTIYQQKEFHDVIKRSNDFFLLKFESLPLKFRNINFDKKDWFKWNFLYQRDLPSSSPCEGLNIYGQIFFLPLILC